MGTEKMGISDFAKTPEDRSIFPPFDNGNTEFIGSGLDYKVYRVGSWVYKEPNDIDKGGNLKSLEEIHKLKNPERISKAIEEQEILRGIYGEEHFLENHYTVGKDLNGEDSVLIFQRYIGGKTLDKLVGDSNEYTSLEELVFRNREQFMDLWGSTLKAFQEFSIPIDIHEGNFMKDSKTGNIYLIDWGRPSEEYDCFLKSLDTLGGADEEIAISGIFKRIEKIRDIERYLKISEEERNDLYQKHSVSANVVEEKIKFLEEIRDKREILKTNEERKRIDDFLNSVFGDSGNISGQQIVEATLKLIEEEGITEIPEKTQSIINNLLANKEEARGRHEWVDWIVSRGQVVY